MDQLKKHIDGNEMVSELLKMDPLVFFGTCKWLGVQFMEEDGKTPLDAHQILDNFLAKWASMNRQYRRKVVKAMKEINKEKFDSNRLTHARPGKNDETTPSDEVTPQILTESRTPTKEDTSNA